MIKVLNVDIDHLKNETCAKTRDYPEGRFPDMHVEIIDSRTLRGIPEVITVKTCACGEGHVTYGTCRIPVEGMIFESKEALMHYLKKDDAYAVKHPGIGLGTF